MTTPASVVRSFIQIVRSGKAPYRAAEFMAEKVLAHQMNAEHPETIERTPENYAEHIREFLHMYGQYHLEITEFLADGDKVYVRWKQTGTHKNDIGFYKATNKPLTEIGSGVYLVTNNKITEYWIQTDREGLQIQLKSNQLKTNK